VKLKIASASHVSHLNAGATATGAVSAVTVETAVKTVYSRCIMYIIIGTVVINCLL
jgi:hypothetical protein